MDREPVLDRCPAPSTGSLPDRRELTEPTPQGMSADPGPVAVGAPHRDDMRRPGVDPRRGSVPRRRTAGPGGSAACDGAGDARGRSESPVGGKGGIISRREAASAAGGVRGLGRLGEPPADQPLAAPDALITDEAELAEPDEAVLHPAARARRREPGEILEGGGPVANAGPQEEQEGPLAGAQVAGAGRDLCDRTVDPGAVGRPRDRPDELVGESIRPRWGRSDPDDVSGGDPAETSPSCGARLAALDDPGRRPPRGRQRARLDVAGTQAGARAGRQGQAPAARPSVADRQRTGEGRMALERPAAFAEALSDELVPRTSEQDGPTGRAVIAVPRGLAAAAGRLL
jgi:hypothetical protein